MIQSKNIIPVTEVSGAVTTASLDGAQIQSLRTDPHAFIYSAIGLDVSDDLSINIIDNEDNVVHLALPYYSFIDVMASAEISDGNLAEVQGGEFFIILLPTLLGAGIGAAVGTSLFAAGSIGAGAVIGCAVAGGAIGGAVGGVAAGVAVGAAAGAQANQGKHLDGSSK